MAQIKLRWGGRTNDSFIRIVDFINDMFSELFGRSESLIIPCSDETTALTTGTGKVTFRMPYAFTLTNIYGNLTTAQTSGSLFTVDVKRNGVSILLTKLTIDNTKKDSVGSLTPPQFSQLAPTLDLLFRDEISVDISQIGDGTAKGLKVELIGHQ